MTGWNKEDITKRYADLTKYRPPIQDDLDEDTWMDIVNRKAKPYIRNVGILRSVFWGP